MYAGLLRLSALLQAAEQSARECGAARECSPLQHPSPSQCAGAHLPLLSQQAANTKGLGCTHSSSPPSLQSTPGPIPSLMHDSLHPCRHPSMHGMDPLHTPNPGS